MENTQPIKHHSKYAQAKKKEGFYLPPRASESLTLLSLKLSKSKSLIVEEAIYNYFQLVHGEIIK